LASACARIACAIGCIDRRSTDAAERENGRHAGAVQRHDVDDFRPAARERAGFIERHAADAARPLEMRAALD
jgi:hypothetical protein